MHVLLNDYGSGVMLLGSDLYGCFLDRVSAQACLGQHPARNSFMYHVCNLFSSLCDWFSLNDIKGARPERSGRFLCPVHWQPCTVC